MTFFDCPPTPEEARRWKITRIKSMQHFAVAHPERKFRKCDEIIESMQFMTKEERQLLQVGLSHIRIGEGRKEFDNVFAGIIKRIEEEK